MSQQVDYTDHYFQVNGLRIHAAIWPSPRAEAVPLVILHGIGDSIHTFAGVAARFAERRTVYALDLRGHGASDKPAEGYRFEDYAADVLGVIDQLPRRPVHLLGHSLGALVAIHVAASAGAPLHKLVLEDPPLITERNEEEIRGLMRFCLDLKLRPLPEVAAAVGGDFPSLPSEWHEAAARSLVNTAGGPFHALDGGEQPIVDWAALMARIALPVLVLAADPEAGGMLGHEERVLLYNYLPAAQLLEFAGCNHQIEADRTEAFLAAVEDFLVDGL